MQFWILGPLEVVEDGKPLGLGGQQQRALLVTLLLDANRTVSTDRLLDVLWGAAPPATAAKALQVHISHLRRLLGRERVVTRPSGYELRVGPDELDLERFERLWGQGNVHDALAQWRSAALPEFRYHTAIGGEIARLEERRLTCLDERLDADLAAGLHESLVPELESLTREHPLREGLRTRLMLALYRSHRQAEALQVYQDARQLLTDELGIEPGRSLRELQRRILEQDAGLDLPRDAEAEEPAPQEAEAPPPIAAAAATADVRKTVTAVTARLTARDAAVDPEMQRQLLGTAIEAFESSVRRHGGTIDSVTGERATAVFGIPSIHEDDALRAVRAADEVLRQLATDDVHVLAVGIGVGTGRVVAGEGRQLRITGGPLQRSSRLGDDAAAWEVLLDDPTWRRVRQSVTCEPRGRDWHLLDPTVPTAPQARLAAPMIGRERERLRLDATFEQAVADASCQLFTVLGPAGVGKSRLVQEFLDGVSESVRIARGRCLPYGEGITFWPLLEAVTEAVGATASDPREVARERLAAAFHEPKAVDIADRLARLVGLAEGETGVEEGFAAVRSLFASLATRQPLVVVFDDIHWAETTFLDLIEDIAVWSRDAPIFLVCLARPELLDERPGWGGGKLNSTTAFLEPLDAAESERLIAELLGESELGADVPARIVEGAEGNPLFIEEMLLMLIEDGLLAHRHGRWQATGDLDRMRVPPTIEALIATRLDQLDAVERAVLERAAVAGKVFYEQAVRELLPESLRQGAAGVLRTLVRKELIRPERPGLGGASYRFRHLLIHDAAYDATSKRSRAQLHEQFGRWLDQVAADRATEYEEVIGYHFEQAYRYRIELGMVDRDARQLAQHGAGKLGDAGRRALSLGDLTAALNLLSRATALLPADDPLRVELVPNVRRAQATNRDLSWADRVLTEAVQAAATSGDRLLTARALVQRGFLRLIIEPDVTADELIASADQSIGIFTETGDELGLAHAWRLMAQAHYLARRARASAEAAEHALGHARRAADNFEEQDTIEWLATALLFGPTPAHEALARCRRLLDETAEDGPIAPLLLAFVAWLVTMTEGSEAARPLAEQSRSLTSELGQQIGIPAFARSYVYMAAGDPVRAEDDLRQSYAALKQLGEQSNFNAIAQALAVALYLQGRLEEAERMTRECEEACRPNDVHSHVLWRSTRAKILARSGRLAEAEALARESHELAAATDFLLARAHSTLDLAEVLLMAGRPREAEAARAEAADILTLKGVRLDVGLAWAGATETPAAVDS